MNKIYGRIYKITNIINNKIYIGQTTREDGFNSRYTGKGIGIERVFNYYEYKRIHNECYNIHLYDSIKKYGFSAFKIDENFDIAYSKEELDEKERYYINLYNSSKKDFGYNIKTGGANGRLEGENKIDRWIKRGNTILCANTNEIFLSAKEVSDKMNIPYRTIMTGVYIDEKTKEKIIFRPILQDEFKKGKPKPVTCLTTGLNFKNALQASKYYSCNRSSIVLCCYGKQKSAGKDPITGEKLRWSWTSILA